MAAANAVTVIVHSDDDGGGGEFANSNVEQIVSLSIMRCNILSHNWHRRNGKEISLSLILHSLSFALFLSASEVRDVVANVSGSLRSRCLTDLSYAKSDKIVGFL